MDHIIVVSGLPRSGTSLMMQMLKNGGMEILTDNIRKADENNPKGYFELEKVKKLKEDSSWVIQARGRAFKAVSMLLYDLPSTEKYKIIFMERNMAEILASQRKMLNTLNQDQGPDDVEMTDAFINHLEKMRQWLEKQSCMDVLYVCYNDLLKDSEDEARKIARFVDVDLGIEKMAEVIDPSLHRNSFP